MTMHKLLLAVFLIIHGGITWAQDVSNWGCCIGCKGVDF